MDNNLKRTLLKGDNKNKSCHQTVTSAPELFFHQDTHPHLCLLILVDQTG